MFSISDVYGQRTIKEILTDKVRPFEKDTIIEIHDFLNNKTHVPLSIIKGKYDGPVFTMVAGVHGFEYPPIVAIQKLMTEINTDTLMGTLIIIPVANVGSFYSRTPFINPLDKTNLNNAFPGKSDGTVTQKIAHFMTKQIIPLTDVFLDIHGGDASEDLLPFICYYNNKKHPEKTRMARLLSEKSGFEYVVSYPYTLKDHAPAKYAFKQACQDGKIALSIESGKLGNVQEIEINLIKNAVYNMLSQLRMYTHINQKIGGNIQQLNRQAYIDADAKGIFYSDFKAGDKVEKGAIVGYITDEFGKIISSFNAPVSGVILYKIGTPPVNVDDTIMCISYFDN